MPIRGAEKAGRWGEGRRKNVRKRKKTRTESDDAFQRERDCFVNCSVSDKYDWPERAREPRIIPPMFHYTVNHRVCPEALARKPIDSFSSTEPNRFRRFRFIKGLQSSTV